MSGNGFVVIFSLQLNHQCKAKKCCTFDDAKQWTLEMIAVPLDFQIALPFKTFSSVKAPQDTGIQVTFFRITQTCLARNHVLLQHG